METHDWQAVVEEYGPLVWQTAYRLLGNQADAGAGRVDVRRAPIGKAIRLALAAARIGTGCVIGRVSGPGSVNIDKLRETLAPLLAASLEPDIRAKVVEDLQQRYQVALAATYVKVKQELTEQYRDEMNRAAVQTLAASNATTNRLLVELVESIDNAQTQDLTRIARVISRIEHNRIQDKTQFAAGLKRWPAGPRKPAKSFNCSRWSSGRPRLAARPRD